MPNTVKRLTWIISFVPHNSVRYYDCYTGFTERTLGNEFKSFGQDYTVLRAELLNSRMFTFGQYTKLNLL